MGLFGKKKVVPEKGVSKKEKIVESVPVSVVESALNIDSAEAHSFKGVPLPEVGQFVDKPPEFVLRPELGENMQYLTDRGENVAKFVVDILFSSHRVPRKEGEKLVKKVAVNIEEAAGDVARRLAALYFGKKVKM